MPDVGDVLAADMACFQRQVAAGENLAAMADKGHARTGQAALGHGVHGVTAVAMWAGSRMTSRVPVAAGVMLAMLALRPFAPDAQFRFLGAPLGNDAEIMRRACGFQLDAAGHLRVIHPVQDIFILFRADLLVFGDFHAAANGHKQERCSATAP